MQEALYDGRKAEHVRRLARALTDPADVHAIEDLAKDVEEIAADLERGAVDIRHPELMPQR